MAYIKKTEVREFAKRKDLRVSGDFYDALDQLIDTHLVRASERASGNGRKTLKGVDL